MALASALPTLYEYYTGGGINAGLSADKPYFTLNNKNISLYSGALHYFRIPRQYWRDRLRKLKAAGLNTVETYIPWNLHEPEDGHFDFGSGGSDMEDFLDVQEYLKIAKEEDLLVIIRSGPFICAEWEWGGFPSWLLEHDGLKVRTSESKYMSYVTRYFNMLLPILAMYQFMNGGPIVAFQVENEYALASQIDLPYLRQLVDIMKNNGIVELLVTSDNAQYGSRGSIPGLLLQTLNFGSNAKNNLDTLKNLQPNRPLMVMEYWTGWFDQWADVHHTVSTSSFRESFVAILNYPASFNLYLFEGGTNWGFMNGANIGAVGNSNFAPTTSSYDYDAPLTEAGDYTEKYNTIKELVMQHTTVRTAIPEQPKLVPRVKYPNVIMRETLNLNEIIKASQVVQSNNIVPMEKLPINNGSGQSYGYIVYRKENIDIQANATLTITGYVYDTVALLVNGRLISKPLMKSSDLDGFGYWKKEDSSIVLTTTQLRGATIDLVVENWGRGNVGYIYNQYKGLRDDVLINRQKITGWTIVPLEFKKAWTRSLNGWRNIEALTTAPALYRGTLVVDGEPADTFVDLQKWTKGSLIVNGFVLGKYARIGPQQTLYLPGPFLKTGNNEIVVFEEFTPAKEIEFSTDAIYMVP